jgi:hypothetical protein
MVRQLTGGLLKTMRAPLKITFALQWSRFALTFAQLTEIAYL